MTFIVAFLSRLLPINCLTQCKVDLPSIIVNLTPCQEIHPIPAPASSISLGNYWNQAIKKFVCLISPRRSALAVRRSTYIFQRGQSFSSPQLAASIPSRTLMRDWPQAGRQSLAMSD
ncbi:hypothetical protein TR2A62_0202 [Thalassobium sp. R2A62]|nr:hypothetical protein TR2A62_0202 [Thalassobium sp. R2A62]